ncbi:hypothetical protein ACO11K_002425 [Bacillus cytotoxicus]|nr:hypothetical protein [Bacillus cereus group sp. BfR-BA-01492]
MFYYQQNLDITQNRKFYEMMYDLDVRLSVKHDPRGRFAYFIGPN